MASATVTWPSRTVTYEFFQTSRSKDIPILAEGRKASLIEVVSSYDPELWKGLERAHVEVRYETRAYNCDTIQIIPVHRCAHPCDDRPSNKLRFSDAIDHAEGAECRPT